MADVILEKVGKTYGKHRIISDFSVTIQDGEFLHSSGRPAAGKRLYSG